MRCTVGPPCTESAVSLVVANSDSTQNFSGQSAQEAWTCISNDSLERRELVPREPLYYQRVERTPVFGRASYKGEPV